MKNVISVYQICKTRLAKLAAETSSETESVFY